MDETTLICGPARTGGAGGRDRIVAAGDGRRFEVSVSFVIKLVQRWRRNVMVQPGRYGGWKRMPWRRMPSACGRCLRPSLTSRSPSCAPAWRPKGSGRARRGSAASSPQRT